MSFEKAMGKMKFDIRLLEYNLAQGFITKEEYDKHLNQLEDSAHLISVANDDDDDTDTEVDDVATEEPESH